MRKHLVYFHPDKKNGYGATRMDRWPKRLIEQGLDLEKGYIVEKDLTLEQASEREEFLQLRDGYPTDSHNYKTWMNTFHFKSREKKVRKKAMNSIDWDKRNKNYVLSRGQRVKSISPDGIVSIYNSISEAGRNLPMDYARIWYVLKHGGKAKGYTFEYA